LELALLLVVDQPLTGVEIVDSLTSTRDLLTEIDTIACFAVPPKQALGEGVGLYKPGQLLVVDGRLWLIYGVTGPRDRILELRAKADDVAQDRIFFVLTPRAEQTTIYALKPGEFQLREPLPANMKGHPFLDVDWQAKPPVVVARYSQELPQAWQVRDMKAHDEADDHHTLCRLAIKDADGKLHYMNIGPTARLGQTSGNVILLFPVVLDSEGATFRAKLFTGSGK
jgi:hypothetical protein